MAFPILHRLLFGNDGAGPKLRSDILPTATADTPGAVTTGDGITNTSGKISIDLSPYAKAADVATGYLPLTGGTIATGAEAGINLAGQARICSYIDGAVCIRNLKDTTRQRSTWTIWGSAVEPSRTQILGTISRFRPRSKPRPFRRPLTRERRLG